MSKKIVIISDSHGHHDLIDEVVEKEFDFDVLIHCGDGVNDLMHVDLPQDIPIVRVSGNVDRLRGINIESKTQITIDSIKCFVTHGDLFHVKNSYDTLIHEGKNNSNDIILFGHTHIPYYKKSQTKGEPILFNPGPLKNGDYGIMQINNTNTKKINLVHKSL